MESRHPWNCAAASLSSNDWPPNRAQGGSPGSSANVQPITDHLSERPRRWPLAYFITFSCYGTRVHGDEAGSVDREHNALRTPYLDADMRRSTSERRSMKAATLTLDQVRRRNVLVSIRESCEYRGWTLYAAHVRSTHVHVVAAASAEPENMMGILKSRASRSLADAGLEPRSGPKWAVHGSTRWLWVEAEVERAVDYVLEGQGRDMEVYRRD